MVKDLEDNKIDGTDTDSFIRQKPKPFHHTQFNAFINLLYKLLGEEPNKGIQQRASLAHVTSLCPVWGHISNLSLIRRILM